MVELYTRRLRADAMVSSLAEKTSRQPRPRRPATRPAPPGRPCQVEHEYRRTGALHRFAAFDTRMGHVYGKGYERKRRREFIAFLAYLEMAMPAPIKTMHLVGDNARAHTSKAVHAWLKAHPRFVVHFTPVPCSGRNQVEQWFSILHCRRRRLVDLAATADLEAKLLQFIAVWNDVAHPFHWTPKSVARVMAEGMPAAAYNWTPACVELYLGTSRSLGAHAG